MPAVCTHYVQGYARAGGQRKWPAPYPETRPPKAHSGEASTGAKPHIASQASFRCWIKRRLDNVLAGGPSASSGPVQIPVCCVGSGQHPNKPAQSGQCRVPKLHSDHGRPGAWGREAVRPRKAGQPPKCMLSPGQVISLRAAPKETGHANIVSSTAHFPGLKF